MFLFSLSFVYPACGRGFYKSSSQDLQCSRCPTHSFSDKEGSSRCECEDGYYRAPSDPPYVACTSKFIVVKLQKDFQIPSVIEIGIEFVNTFTNLNYY